jgi:hypothetical protein
MTVIAEAMLALSLMPVFPSEAAGIAAALERVGDLRGRAAKTDHTFILDEIRRRVDQIRGAARPVKAEFDEALAKARARFGTGGQYGHVFKSGGSARGEG